MQLTFFSKCPRVFGQDCPKKVLPKKSIITSQSINMFFLLLKKTEEIILFLTSKCFVMFLFAVFTTVGSSARSRIYYFVNCDVRCQMFFVQRVYMLRR